MSKLRDFFTGLPLACGVEDGIAEIEGERNGKLFDFDKENPDSAMQRYPGKTSFQRLVPAWKSWEHLAEPSTLEYAQRLSVFADKSSRFNSKGIGDKQEIGSEAVALKVLEPKFASVSSLMTVSYASTLTNWN